MADDATRIRLLQNIHELQPQWRTALKTLESYGDLGEHLYEIWRELSSYRAGEEPHKAVYVLASARTALTPFGLCYAHIAAYKEAEKKLADYDLKKAIENG